MPTKEEIAAIREAVKDADRKCATRIDHYSFDKIRESIFYSTLARSLVGPALEIIHHEWRSKGMVGELDPKFEATIRQLLEAGLSVAIRDAYETEARK